MPKEPIRADDRREVVEATLALVRSRLDEWIINLRHAGSPLADGAIRWKGQSFLPPTK